VLARHGFVGPTRAYEGRFGLFASHLQERFRRADLALATAGLGTTWELLQVAVKPFPACHFTHACADAAIALVGEQGLDPRSVRRVRALVPEAVVKTVCEPVANKRRPANAYDAQFSIPYIVAASLRRGRFTLAELDEAALADPEILALAERVEYEVDPLSSFPRHYSGALVVECADGRELSHREQVNRGCGDRPLAEAEIVAKYRDNAARAVPPAKAAAIEAAILGWDAAPDMRRLAEVLAAG
jgi:2-methylcitrate dehydratase PrpD